MRMRVIIGLPYTLVYLKRRLKETGKTEVLYHSRCGTIKIPLCSKALRVEYRPKFFSPSPAMVTSQ
jgi:hypothetical protein